MKVNALFLFDIETFEEQVHQKGLAATNAAPDVKTLYPGYRRRRPAGQESQQPPSRWPVIVNALLEVFESLDDIDLYGITDMAFSG